MSTIEPEVMDDGNKMEGNSICYLIRTRMHTKRPVSIYQSFIFGKEDGDTSVNLTHGQGDQHLDNSKSTAGSGIDPGVRVASDNVWQAVESEIRTIQLGIYRV